MLQALTATLMLFLPSNCALSGSVTFIIPQVYLSVNPGGSTTMSFTMGSNSLQTTLMYTRVSADSLCFP